jgi:uncharacterized protein YuzE
MAGVEIRYCTDVEAFYVTIGGGKVARTAHISDDVMVDTEADGTVHGIELLCTPAESPTRSGPHSLVGFRRRPRRPPPSSAPADPQRPTGFLDRKKEDEVYPSGGVLRAS